MVLCEICYFTTSLSLLGLVVGFLFKGSWWFFILAYLVNLIGLYIISFIILSRIPIVGIFLEKIPKIYLVLGGIATIVSILCNFGIIQI